MNDVMCRFQNKCNRSECMFKHIMERASFFRELHSKLKEKITTKESLRRKNQPIRKRAIKRNKKVKNEILKLFGINAASIKCKIDSFNEVLSRLKPQIWMIEKTKLKPHEDIRCGALIEFQVFYLSRQESQGGGLALGVNKMFESTFLSEGDDDTEVMSVLVVVGNIPIRIIVGY